MKWFVLRCKIMTSTLLPRIKCMKTNVVLNFAHSKQCRLQKSKTAKRLSSLSSINLFYELTLLLFYYLWVVKKGGIRAQSVLGDPGRHWQHISCKQRWVIVAWEGWRHLATPVTKNRDDSSIFWPKSTYSYY